MVGATTANAAASSPFGPGHKRLPGLLSSPPPSPTSAGTRPLPPFLALPPGHCQRHLTRAAEVSLAAVPLAAAAPGRGLRRASRGGPRRGVWGEWSRPPTATRQVSPPPSPLPVRARAFAGNGRDSGGSSGGHNIRSGRHPRLAMRRTRRDRRAVVRPSKADPPHWWSLPSAGSDLRSYRRK
eukprot:359270-Chlamydomonas_euryale.AAC.6